MSLRPDVGEDMEETLTALIMRLDDGTPGPGIPDTRDTVWGDMFCTRVEERARCTECNRTSKGAVLEVLSTRLRFRAEHMTHTTQGMLDDHFPETRMLPCAHCGNDVVRQHAIELRMTGMP